MVKTITRKTKMEGQRKAKKRTAHKNQKKGRELIPLMVGSYLTHDPSNVAYMQIVSLNNNGRSRTNITRQHNFPLYSKS